MAFKLGKFSARNLLTCALGIGAALLLASCGGGGGSAGTPSGGSPTPTVSLNLVSPSTATTPLAAYGTTTITVQVLSNGAAGGSGVTVNFASPCATAGKATLPTSGTTGSDGKVTVTYADGGCAASDIVSISSTGATTITETLQIATPTVASIQFVSASPTTDSIVIKGAGGNGRVETATLTYEVVDTHGKPLPNQTVTFSLFPAGVVNLQQTSAITDANGKVVAAVSSGTTSTTFRVNASVNTTVNGNTTTLTTESDSIIVTTGQTSQESFTLDATTYNIEGWNYDNITTPVNVFLADSNGNPVADGTPVVFSTDSGAIGSAVNGGCTTTDGTCSVSFRSQNPRFGSGASAPGGKRPGLATVVASTTTSNLTFGGQIGIFLSGSTVANPILSIAAANGTANGLTLTLSSCNSVSFGIQLNDVNNNPMPATTAVAVTPMTFNAAPTVVVGSVFPNTVLNTGIASVTDTTSVLGTWHTITFQPGGGTGSTTACNSNGAPFTGGLNVNVTTPKTNVTQIPVTIIYPH